MTQKKNTNYFTVDKDGLAKIIESRGKPFAVFELIQNSWDQNVTRVDINLDKFPNRPFAELTVTDDDPDGFADLSHAYTLNAQLPTATQLYPAAL